MTPHRPTPHPARHRLVAGVLALLLLGGLAACGVDDGDEATDDPTTTEAEATTTVEDEPDGTTTEPDDEGSTTTTTDDDDTSTTTGDPADLDEDQYVTAMAEGFTTYGTGDVPECLAQEWVDELGYDELVASGVDPAGLASGDDDEAELLGIDEGQASNLFDAFATCDVDLIEVLVGIQVQDPTPDQISCVAAIITDDVLRASFVSEFTEDDSDSADDPSDEAFDQAEDQCLPDDEDDDSTTGSTAGD